MSGATVDSAFAEARRRGIAGLDAQLMLARLLATPRTRLIARGDAPIPAPELARWSSWLERRAAGEPLAYLLGEKEFFGLVLEVTPDVLVPRPETELLVAWGDELLRRRAPGAAAALDLGTGSGAIALALKRLQPQAHVVATDRSAPALAVARRNAERHGLAVELVESDWWRGLAGRHFDLVVANPPYIAADDPHLAVLAHEPRQALTPGDDACSALAAIVAGAAPHLNDAGWLLLEHGFDQGAAVRALLEGAGFDDVETRNDLAGLARASGGRR